MVAGKKRSDFGLEQMVEWGDGEYCGKSRFGWEHQEFSFEMSTGNERDVDKAGLYRNEELEDRSGGCQHRIHRIGQGHQWSKIKIHQVFI